MVLRQIFFGNSHEFAGQFLSVVLLASPIVNQVVAGKTRAEEAHGPIRNAEGDDVNEDEENPNNREQVAGVPEHSVVRLVYLS